MVNGGSNKNLNKQQMEGVPKVRKSKKKHNKCNDNYKDGDQN